MKETTLYAKVKITLNSNPGKSHVYVDGKEIPCSKIIVVQDVNQGGLKVQLDVFAEDVEVITDENQELKLNIKELI